jgi:acetyltransferase
VAERATADGRREIAGIGRLSKDGITPTGEFAVLVADPWQGRGLGTELLRRIVAVARAERLDRVGADISAENERMAGVAEKLGFTVERDPGASMFRADLDLRDGA